MPVEVTLHACIEVGAALLPDRCPNCEADLTEFGAYNEWNWLDVAVSSHIEEGESTPEGGYRDGEDFRPTEYRCSSCDHVLTNLPNLGAHEAGPQLLAHLKNLLEICQAKGREGKEFGLQGGKAPQQAIAEAAELVDRLSGKQVTPQQ